jgi:hypothetical protein
MEYSQAIAAALLGSAGDTNMDLLAEHHLQGTSAVFYIPNFISEDEEQYLLRKVSHSRTSQFLKCAPSP